MVANYYFYTHTHTSSVNTKHYLGQDLFNEVRILSCHDQNNTSQLLWHTDPLYNTQTIHIKYGSVHIIGLW